MGEISWHLQILIVIPCYPITLATSIGYIATNLAGDLPIHWFPGRTVRGASLDRGHWLGRGDPRCGRESCQVRHAGAGVFEAPWQGAQKRKNWNADIHNVCIYYIIISYNVYNCRIMCIYVYIDVINVIKHIFCIIHVLCIYVRLVVSHNLFVFPIWADDPQLDWLQIRQQSWEMMSLQQWGYSKTKSADTVCLKLATQWGWNLQRWAWIKPWTPRQNQGKHRYTRTTKNVVKGKSHRFMAFMVLPPNSAVVFVSI